MVGGSQQIILEIVEKLLAGWALGVGGGQAWMALMPLTFRRELVNARLAVWREIYFLFACVFGLGLARWIPLPMFGAWGLLALSLAVMATARMPLPRPADFHGKRWRNLFGFALFGFGMWAFGRALSDLQWLTFSAVALAGVTVHFLFVKRNGEPGLLIPGCFVLAAGACGNWESAAGFGFGLMLPAAYLIGRNMGGSWLLRALICAVGAAAADLVETRYAVWALTAVFLLSLETWRFALRWLVLSLLMVLYRFRIHGEQNVPYKGPAVLIGNHVSLLDGFLIAAHTQRLARFLVYDAYFKNPLMRFGLNLFRTIPISQGGKRDMIESLREARRRIEEGHVAGIFPEGSVTRNGFFNAYQKGITRVVQGAALQIVPAYMNGLWMSFVSFSEGGFHLTLPRLHRDLEIEYGEAIDSNASHGQLWAKVKELEVRAAFRDSDRMDVLPRNFLRAAKRYARLAAVRDGNRELTYGELAEKATALAQRMRVRWPKKSRVSVKLPMGADRVTAYVALALAGHVAVAGSDVDAVLDNLEVGEAGAALGVVERDEVAMLARSEVGWVPLSFRGLQAAAHAARRVLWMKPGTTVRSAASWESSAAFVLGLWTPLLHGATIVASCGLVDFEIRHVAWPGEAGEAKHVLQIETATIAGEDGENVYPVLEAPELSGIAALSAPPVTVAGDTQGGAKAGYVGRLPFGVEAKVENGVTYFRSPQRCLPHEGAARPGDWVASSIRGVEDFGEVERASTSVSSTSTS
jgi:1-acyl-sn-glycerol-3-phosphate acyltransferase